MYTNIELEKAIEIMKDHVHKLDKTYVDLNDALGCILAEDIIAPMDQPPFDRSPLDGYAVRSKDLVTATRENPVRLHIVDNIYAGQEAVVPVEAMETVRLTTGTMLPQGADCVVRQEDTDRDGDYVSFYKSVKSYENYCYKGEDYKKGQLLFQAGLRLDAAALGVLASAGMSRNVPVYKYPSVALICTGSEIVPPSEPILPLGKIHGINETYLMARFKEIGIQRMECVYVPDEPEEASKILMDLLETYDMVVTTGGVSVGEKDIMHEVLPMIHAEQIFWKVLLKPGSPIMFAICNGKPILALSGNPFAAAATFELMGRPLMSFMMGNEDLLPEKITGILDNDFSKASKGRRFIRGCYKNGKVWLPDTHASGIMSSFAGCNCLVDIPAGSPALKKGDEVNVVLL